MKFLTRSLMGLFLTALTLGLLAAGGYAVIAAISARNAAPERPAQARERVFAANVVTLDFGTRVPRLTAYGEIRAVRRLELRAAAAGRIRDLSPNFVEGGTVSAGELLVQLDPAEAQAARDTAAAARGEAQAALALAERTMAIASDDLTAAGRQADLRRSALDRQRSIDAKGFGKAADTETAELAVSAADQAVLTKRTALSAAEAGLDQARNTLRRAEITLGEAERKLRDTMIRAGFAGNLAGISAVKGRVVATNEMLGELIDPAALEVSFRVSTAQFARLTDAAGALVPMQAEVALDLQGRTLSAPATLVRVGAAVETGQTGRQLFARLDAPAGFKAGDFVTVTLDAPPLEAVAEVPSAAVGADGRVLLLGAGDRLAAVPVEVLHRQGDTVLIRAAGLATGQEIVAERTPLLGEGLKLRPLRPGAAATAPALVPLDAARRARLIAQVEANARMPSETKARLLAQLAEEAVPAELIDRLEARTGG